MAIDARRRLEALVDAWRLTIEETRETNTSLLAFGWRDGDPVVLKVIRQSGDEWRSGQTVKAYDGRGVVRALEFEEGAVLLERSVPGRSLVPLVLAGRDDEATHILAGVIRQMAGAEPPVGCVTVEEWGAGFDRYLRNTDATIPKDLVEEARDVYLDLWRTQQDRRLLHGDLHHGNVLFDSRRGWLAIDPKGVFGEMEYEVGTALRNPCSHPQLYASREIFQRRARLLEQTLNLDIVRTTRWAFAQAVLSAVWCWEDGEPVQRADSALLLAREIRDYLNLARLL